MARYTGPTCKLARREGSDLNLKSPARAIDSKCKLEQKPGQHGPVARKGKLSDYATQLREKQKVKRIYGLLERQFHGYYAKAARGKGNTGESLLQMLERRLDNVVYRAGFAHSRDMARQLVKHGHFTVNGQKVDIPSFLVSENDIIDVRSKSLEMTPFVIARAEAGSRPVPAWIEVISNRMRILVHSMPARQVIDTPVQQQLIVELYSK